MTDVIDAIGDLGFFHGVYLLILVVPAFYSFLIACRVVVIVFRGWPPNCRNTDLLRPLTIDNQVDE